YSGVSALLPAYNALFGLLLVLSTHDAKNDRDTAIECNSLDSLGRCITHEHIMACRAFHHTPKTDERVIVSIAHQRLSNGCQFIRPRSAHLVNIMCRHSQLEQFLSCEFEHCPRNLPVIACNDDA